MRLADYRLTFAETEPDDKFGGRFSFPEKLEGGETIVSWVVLLESVVLVQDIQAMVVLILPTFVSNAILANSMANSGVSTILSLRTLEHLFELNNALTYRSQKLTRGLPGAM